MAKHCRSREFLLAAENWTAAGMRNDRQLTVLVFANPGTGHTSYYLPGISASLPGMCNPGVRYFQHFACLRRAEILSDQIVRDDHITK
jgi:hypothetical protein